MSTQTLRQRNAIRSYRSQQNAAAVENDWRATPVLRVVPPVAPPKPTRMDRVVATINRLHDGLPLLWAAAGIVVLYQSAHYTAVLWRAFFGTQL